MKINVGSGENRLLNRLADAAEGDWVEVPAIEVIDETLGGYNVRDYGAVGNGSTDDTTAISNAIAAAIAAGGGVVSFPPGTYLTSGNHSITGGKVQLEGSGVNATVISHSGNNSCFIFTAPGVTNQRCGIRHMLIDGNTGASARGIEFRDLNYGGWAEHVRITDYTAGSGVLLHNSASSQFTEGVQLDDVSISNSAIGIDFYRTSGTDSFNSTHMKNVAINVPNSGTGISVGARASSGVCVVYNSTWTNVQIWFDSSTNSFGLDIGNNSVVRDTTIWAHAEGSSGSTTVVRVQSGSTLSYLGDLQMGDNTTWTLSGTYHNLGASPTSLGGNSTQATRKSFVAGRSTPSLGRVISAHAFNGTTPSIPGTEMWGVTKEGYIQPFSGQANSRLFLGTETGYTQRFRFRDGNSVDYLVAGDTYSDAILRTLPPGSDASNTTIASANLRMQIVGPVRRAGFLRDVSVYIATQSGNIELSVWDTGDAAGTTTITKLANSGSISSGGGNAWVTYDPGASAVPVVPGQYLFFGVQADNGTVTAGRALVQANTNTLPSNFPTLPGGTVVAKFGSTIAATLGSLPSTIASGSLTVNSTIFLMVARIA